MKSGGAETDRWNNATSSRSDAFLQRLAVAFRLSDVEPRVKQDVVQSEPLVRVWLEQSSEQRPALERQILLASQCRRVQRLAVTAGHVAIDEHLVEDDSKHPTSGRPLLTVAVGVPFRRHDLLGDAGPEIDQFQLAVLRVDEHILDFEVGVEDAAPTAIDHTLDQLAKQPPGRVLVETAPIEHVEQSLASFLHDDHNLAGQNEKVNQLDAAADASDARHRRHLNGHRYPIHLFVLNVFFLDRFDGHLQIVLFADSARHDAESAFLYRFAH